MTHKNGPRRFFLNSNTVFIVTPITPQLTPCAKLLLDEDSYKTFCIGAWTVTVEDVNES